MPSTILHAVHDALDTALGKDDRVVILGEDVGVTGGVFRATDGLQKKHGEERVFDTPLAEGVIAGVSVGLAAQEGTRGGMAPEKCQIPQNRNARTCIEI